MTLYPSGTINPENIISGQSIRCFDNSTADGEVVTKNVWYVNEGRVVTMAPGSSSINIANANTLFTVGETVVWGGGQPPPFQPKTQYYVVYVESTFLRLSATSGGTAIVCTGAGTTLSLFKGSSDQYPVIKPYPVTSASTRTIRQECHGSLSAYSLSSYTFYTVMSESEKPTKSTNFEETSIFVYKGANATVLNRTFKPNLGLLYTDLKFTGSINKAGTASFTAITSGTATETEETLMTADNYVAIIAGESVVWSGKILRSTQTKMSLYSSSSAAKTWEIECESDISRIRLEDVKAANKGRARGTIGTVISQLVDGTVFNWNGDSYDPSIRSNEGPEVTFYITDADMYTQFQALSKIIDFDWRTRLINQRYHYNTFNGVSAGITSMSPYPVTYFTGKWMLFCQNTTGVVTYGYITGASTTSLSSASMKNPTLSPSSGTVLILGNPVLDVLSDLSQASKQATFRINYPRSPAYSFGHEFDDKTDKKLLATKVVAKGRDSAGNTITSAVAAVQPFKPSTCSFEKSTYVTKRTEGVVIQYDFDGVSHGYLYLEGWNYDAESGDYLGYFASGTYSFAKTASYSILGAPVETTIGSRRVTRFYVYNNSWVAPATWCVIFKAADPTNYASFYVKSLTDLEYTNTMNVYIGGETITTVDYALNTAYGYRIRYICDGTANHRNKDLTVTGAHGTGSILWKTYSETSPAVGSPVYYHGLIVNSYNTDQNTVYTRLESYATLYLIAYSYYYRKATFKTIIYDFFRTDAREANQLTSPSFLREGDRIVCLPKSTDSETDMVYGQYKNVWQIVAYTFDANSMQVLVELGDFERNMFTLLTDKTAAINSTIS